MAFHHFARQHINLADGWRHIRKGSSVLAERHIGRIFPTLCIPERLDHVWLARIIDAETIDFYDAPSESFVVMTCKDIVRSFFPYAIELIMGLLCALFLKIGTGRHR